MDQAVVDIEVLAPSEVAKALKVSLSLVYRWAERGQIACERIPSPSNNGKRAKSTVRFRVSDVVAFIEANYRPICDTQCHTKNEEARQ